MIQNQAELQKISTNHFFKLGKQRKFLYDCLFTPFNSQRLSSWKSLTTIALASTAQCRDGFKIGCDREK